MNKLRFIYRNSVVEFLLMTAVLNQIVTGIKLLHTTKSRSKNNFEKLQAVSGLYLTFFFVVHISAIWFGRLILKVDTNLYFGIAGLNNFPHSLFFIPYYSLAILSLFGHISTIHYKKIARSILGLSPRQQSVLIAIIGVLMTGLIIFGLTNGFSGVEIPPEYGVLIGK